MKREAELPPPSWSTWQCCGDKGRLEKLTHPPGQALAGFHRGSDGWQAPCGHMRGQHALPEKHILHRHGIPQPWCGWPFSGLPPFGGHATYQSQGLITCLISGQRPAPAATHELASWERPWQLAVCLLSGCLTYSCLGLFVLVAKPPASAHLSEVQVQRAWLSLLELPESQRNARAACKSLASSTAVRALTADRVCQTSSIHVFLTQSWALEGGLPAVSFISAFATQMIMSVRSREVCFLLVAQVFSAHQPCTKTCV